MVRTSHQWFESVDVLKEVMSSLQSYEHESSVEILEEKFDSITDKIETELFKNGLKSEDVLDSIDGLKAVYTFIIENKRRSEEIQNASLADIFDDTSGIDADFNPYTADDTGEVLAESEESITDEKDALEDISEIDQTDTTASPEISELEQVDIIELSEAEESGALDTVELPQSTESKLPEAIELSEVDVPEPLDVVDLTEDKKDEPLGTFEISEIDAVEPLDVIELSEDEELEQIAISALPTTEPDASSLQQGDSPASETATAEESDSASKTVIADNVNDGDDNKTTEINLTSDEPETSENVFPKTQDTFDLTGENAEDIATAMALGMDELMPELSQTNKTGEFESTDPIATSNHIDKKDDGLSNNDITEVEAIHEQLDTTPEQQTDNNKAVSQPEI